MKRGTCKYKGKIPLVSFDCGEISHFAAKFPYKNKAFTKGKKGQRNFKNQGKKNFLSMEDSSSSEEESDIGEENKERVLFMAKNNNMEAPDKKEDEQNEMTKIEF